MRRSLGWPLGLVALACFAGVARAESAPREPRVPLAEMQGRTLYVDEVEGALAFRIYKHRLDIYSLLRAEAERRIEETLVAAEAERRGLSVEALLAEVAAPVREIPEEEIDRYLAEHPPDPGRNPGQARARVRDYLGERERLERRVTFMQSLREKAGARVLLEPPPRPRTEFALEDSPVRGPRTAPILAIHFASFGSRNSARSAARLERLAAAFPDKIRRAHVHLLNDRDEVGLHAARLASAVAARQPEAFWPLHDALFSREGKLSESQIDAIAVDVGVPATLVAEAARDPRWLGAVKRDFDRAVAAGVPREPGLFLNGLFVSGLVPDEELRALVEDELTREP